MDTGIISIIMNILPWQFQGLGIISTIMFVFNLVLFVAFSVLALIRLFTFPKHVKSETLNALEELSYQGAPAIAYLTLVAQVSLTCSTAWGFRLTILAYVLWWIGLVWTVLLCSASVIVLTKRSITNDRELSPAIFLPLISVMTLGTTGGIVVNYSVGMSARLAIPIIVVSYLCIGYAFFLALLYYAIYAHRLIAVGPPEMAKLPAMVITIGPLGQFATAIQVVSTAANTRGLFGSYNQGTWLTASAASSVSAASELLALMVVGFAFLWVTVAWYLVLEAAVTRKLPYSLTWWSLIFPMGMWTMPRENLERELTEFCRCVDYRIDQSFHCTELSWLPRSFGCFTCLPCDTVVYQLGVYAMEIVHWSRAGNSTAKRRRRRRAVEESQGGTEQDERNHRRQRKRLSTKKTESQKTGGDAVKRDSIPVSLLCSYYYEVID
jgi:tellurite resistance protein TehA-like permease